MPGGQGYRARTRDMFKRGYRQKGYIPLSTYLRTYKLGDFVDVVVNGAVQKVRNLMKRKKRVISGIRDGVMIFLGGHGSFCFSSYVPALCLYMMTPSLY
jgi:hypothetical protein